MPKYPTHIARAITTYPNSQKPFPVPISVNRGSSTGSVPNKVRFLTRFGSNSSVRAVHGSASGHLDYGLICMQSMFNCLFNIPTYNIVSYYQFIPYLNIYIYISCPCTKFL